MVNTYDLIAKLVEKGWRLDCGKTGIHVALLAQTDDAERRPYVAGFYRFKRGRGVYATGATLAEAIEEAAALLGDDGAVEGGS